ncbi:type I restriction enzyme M protein [Nitratiruptor sp. YY08-14]|nr:MULTISPECIES: type I restriction-modification system subunit M N-terminal domain-containing protein [unclassified Nitratiruptor]BCD59482.1 type I restriction enzyme M protein [Nitratiruptor sp. YY08-10]BCD63406.1 type I restriction enzyme M protein [Nitratiruptor sp. YY08-14]
MSEEQQQELGKILWAIADELRGSMNADDFRDYMLAFLFFKYLSSNYEEAVAKELENDYPKAQDNKLPLEIWYEQNKDDIEEFENYMRQKIHYVIKPDFLWNNIVKLAKQESEDLLTRVRSAFKYIENESFAGNFSGLFSEVNLDSDKLGKNYTERNKRLAKIIKEIAKGLEKFPDDRDILGDAYEYLIGQFTAGSGKKAGEFYTPQQVSTILSRIVTLDSQDPTRGKKERLQSVYDFACGSGSLLLNVRKQMGRYGIGKIYGQEKNITTIT